MAANGSVTIVALVGILFLALIGGLVVMAFTKLYGVVFSGMPRAEEADHAREVSLPMLIAMALPLAGILIVGIVPIFALRWVSGLAVGLSNGFGALAPAVGVSPTLGEMFLSGCFGPLSFGVGLLVVFVVVLWMVRRQILKGRPETASPTWNCGFTAVTSHMQYSGESFSEGLGRISERMISNRLDPARIGTDEIFPTEHNFDVRHKDRLDSLFAQWWSYLLRRINARLVIFRTARIDHYVLYALLFLALIFVLTALNLI